MNNYLTCPYCKGEDATEKAETSANLFGTVICGLCNQLYIAVYNSKTDKFEVSKV